MTHSDINTLFVLPSDLRKLLESGQHKLWAKMNRNVIEQVIFRFHSWPQVQTSDSESGRTQQGLMAQHVVNFLIYELDQIQSKLDQLKTNNADYSKRYSKAVTDQERRGLILNFAKQLGADAKQIQGDKKAFSRWFGHDAVADRYTRRYLETERYLSFILQCLGRMSAMAIELDGQVMGHLKLWQQLELELCVKPFLSYEGDKRVLTAAFHSLTEAIAAMPLKHQHSCVSDSTLRFIYHACLASEQSVWVQCEALKLLQSASPSSLAKVLRKRLQDPQSDDDIFVRRKVIEIMGQQLPIDLEMDSLLDIAIQDISPSVRQKIPAALNDCEIHLIEYYYPILLLYDDVEQVRASAVLNLKELLMREECYELALYFLSHFLESEKNKFALRVGLQICCEGIEGKMDRVGYVKALLPAIETLHQNCEFLAVRRWAAQTREYLFVVQDQTMALKLNELQHFIQTIKPGRTRKIPKHLQMENKQFGRLLSVIAQNDHGFDIEQGMFGQFITRGHVFGFRLWRFLHELRHPSPDKRQAFSHTRGRLFWGTLRVPSSILSELAETKVPGEPLMMDTEEGWRGYLPLVDEVISALAVGNQPTWFYHPEGVTCLVPPRHCWRRWLASWRISYYFTKYARLRNWKEIDQDSADSYLSALNELGIKVTLSSHASDYGNSSCDEKVMRFFPLAIPFSDFRVWQGFKDYFVSVYENTLFELAAFMTVAIGYFLGKHIYLYQQLKKARDNLPLVLGGWGTRGKSGTERIKAALMNALGYSIVSKTTGCEAMFLLAYPYGELREMFLFRPYDKATIWEQHNLVCLSDKLNSEVFLWECMGLTPSYIDILQRQWMCDDIATITNTYPDHEDLQGPAGINIPEVMTQFIPEKSSLITTEEQMLPILREAAREKNTQFREVTWLQAGLLADDLLSRFPYDEHPYNIALVMAMGDELGVEADFALKEMADRVVADIGVLKTYPCAKWRGRRLEFINGMSANERFGCLGNWQRMGFDQLTLEKNPDTWVTTVINNRADRIARSRVFASIIVKDISFDRCILIGNNLTGLMSYIKESWQEWIETVSLVADDETPQDILIAMACRFRIPYTKEMKKNRLKPMLQVSIEDESLIDELVSVVDQPEKFEQMLSNHPVNFANELMPFMAMDHQAYLSYQDFMTQLQQPNADLMQLQEPFRQLLWNWFEQKVIMVEDYYATGNEVIKTICDETPPGFYNRILGMQNIKGTGLDFVYRWQAWETCYKACHQLKSQMTAESNKGLTALASFQEFGYLMEEMVLETLENVKESSVAQNERYQAELEIIKNNLQNSIINLNGNKAKQPGGNRWLSAISQFLESFLDAGDAVKRRKKADQIYKDLQHERISHEKAALELQKINKRQKGGWLSIG